MVGSTNDVVRGWLADGVPEVCLAVAAEQTAGRGRQGRSWTAPRGTALLLSLGFRPTWSEPVHAWRLAAVASVAMAEAAEAVACLPAGTIRLKWPNDLVVETAGGVRKLGGVLGETDGLGTPDPRVIVGLGVNADWSPAAFPPDLAESMTSLRELTGDAVDRSELADAFIEALRPRIERLRRRDEASPFDGGEWATRQVTTGRTIRLERADGTVVDARATGVDTETGALQVEPTAADLGVLSVVVGEVVHVRLADPVLDAV